MAKKAKDTKKCVTEQKCRFENYKHCSETTQLKLKNKINNVEEYKLNVDSVSKNLKEFIKKIHTKIRRFRRKSMMYFYRRS